MFEEFEAGQNERNVFRKTLGKLTPVDLANL